VNESELIQAKHLAFVTEELPAIVNSLSAKHGKPGFIDDGTDSRFLYENPTWKTYQMLKSIRLVSTLRSIMVLLQYGHSVEANVLLRTAYDFIADVAFAQDAIANKVNTVEQEREFTQFFERF
jgi:hypothetical protein